MSTTVIVLQPDAPPTSLTVESQADLMVLTGEQGPPGVPGPIGPSGGSAVTRSSATVVSALRVVYELPGGTVAPADYDDPVHVEALLGVTLTAAGVGQPVDVQGSGVLEDAGWSWTPGPLWLGAAGVIVQVPPVDGALVQLGSAVGPTRVILRLEAPIYQE